MASQHTPGPWTTGTNGESGKGLAICFGPYVIAKVYGGGYPIGKGNCSRSTADARLIAASPCLLAAAELGLKIAEYHIRSEYEGTSDLDGMLAELDPVRAAIAKAKAEGAPR